jgi:hypothetical protein
MSKCWPMDECVQYMSSKTQIRGVGITYSRNFTHCRTNGKNKKNVVEKIKTNYCCSNMNIILDRRNNFYHNLIVVKSFTSLARSLKMKGGKGSM